MRTELEETEALLGILQDVLNPANTAPMEEKTLLFIQLATAMKLHIPEPRRRSRKDLTIKLVCAL